MEPLLSEFSAVPSWSSTTSFTVAISVLGLCRGRGTIFWSFSSRQSTIRVFGSTSASFCWRLSAVLSSPVSVWKSVLGLQNMDAKVIIIFLIYKFVC